MQKLTLFFCAADKRASHSGGDSSSAENMIVRVCRLMGSFVRSVRRGSWSFVAVASSSVQEDVFARSPLESLAYSPRLGHGIVTARNRIYSLIRTVISIETPST